MELYPPLIVDRALELSGWRELVLDERVPLEHLDLCPCCTETLEDIVALIGTAGARRVTIGHCLRCGWIGFRHRPTEAWLSTFYLSEWDAAHKNQPAHHNPHNTDEQGSRKQTPSRNTQTLLSIVQGLDLNPKNARILEIGCGYGGALAALKTLGFKNLFGVENSAHRARSAEDSTGAAVLCGDFVTLARDGALKNAAPFDLVFSSHVLEHIANPFNFLTAARELERRDGAIIVSMPNQIREPAAGIIFFLPHLNSFTLTSLTALLGRAAYEVADTTATTNAELFVAARAVENDTTQPLAPHEPTAPILTKFARELGLDKMTPTAAYRRLWWDRKNNAKSGQLPFYFYRPSLFGKLYQAFQKLLHPELRYARSLLVRDADARFTDTPIEFQFEGPVRLFYK